MSLPMSLQMTQRWYSRDILPILPQVMHTRGAHARTSYDFTDDTEMVFLGHNGCPEEAEVDVRELQDVWAGFGKLMEAM